MKIYFTRNTHDENGNYRGDDFFKNPKRPSIKDSKVVYKAFRNNQKSYDESQIFFGVHNWSSSGQKMTLEELYEEQMNLLAAGAYDGKFDINEERFGIAAFLSGLSFMISHRLVKVIVE